MVELSAKKILYTSKKYFLRRDNIYFLLLIVGVVVVLNVTHIFFFLKYGFLYPYGWDTVWYACRAKYLLSYGFWKYFKHVGGYPHVYIIFLAFFSLIFNSIIVAEILLVNVLTCALIIEYYKVGKVVTGKRIFSFLLGFLMIFASNTIRISSDLNRQLLTLVLFYIIVIYFVRKISSVKYQMGTLLILAVMMMTQIETTLITYATMVLFGIRKKNWKFLAMLTFFAPFPLLYFRTIFGRFLMLLSSLNFRSQSTLMSVLSSAWLFQGDLLFLVYFLGVICFPLFYRRQKKHEVRDVLFVLGSFSYILLFLLVLSVVIWSRFLVIVERIILPIPLFLFIWVGVLFFSEILTSLLKRGVHNQVKLKNTFIVFLLVSFVLLTVVRTPMYEKTWYNYYIDERVIRDLHYFSQNFDFNGSLVFIVNNFSTLYSPELYDLFLRHAYFNVGKFYVFFGYIYNLLYAVPPYLQYPWINSLYLARMNKSYADFVGFLNSGSVEDLLVVIFADTLFGNARFYSFLEKYRLEYDIFAIRWVDLENLLESYTVVGTDFQNSSGHYCMSYDWMLADRVVEIYNENASTREFIEYGLPLNSDKSYLVSVHLKMWSSSFMPVTVYFDSKVIATIFYDDSGVSAFWYNFTIPSSLIGEATYNYHYLTFSVDFPGKHALAIDVINVTVLS